MPEMMIGRPRERSIESSLPDRMEVAENLTFEFRIACQPANTCTQSVPRGQKTTAITRSNLDSISLHHDEDVHVAVGRGGGRGGRGGTPVCHRRATRRHVSARQAVVADLLRGPVVRQGPGSGNDDHPRSLVRLLSLSLSFSPFLSCSSYAHAAVLSACQADWADVRGRLSSVLHQRKV